jgi:hypothetical protein
MAYFRGRNTVALCVHDRKSFSPLLVVFVLTRRVTEGKKFDHHQAADKCFIISKLYLPIRSNFLTWPYEASLSKCFGIFIAFASPLFDFTLVTVQSDKLARNSMGR